MAYMSLNNFVMLRFEELLMVPSSLLVANTKDVDLFSRLPLLLRLLPADKAEFDLVSRPRLLPAPSSAAVAVPMGAEY